MTRPTIPDPFTSTAAPRTTRGRRTTTAAAAVPEHRPKRDKPRPTRYTLDLDPGQHQFLKQYAQSIDANAAEVMRALLQELETGQDLAARVRARIWQS